MPRRKKTCGEHGGVTKAGKPCTREEAWGIRGVASGPCKDHREEAQDLAGLTGKQRRFVEEYCGGARFNVTEAARRAGYAFPHPQGQQVLRNLTVAEAISERMKSLAMPAEEVTARLGDMARGSLLPFVHTGPDGRFYIDLDNEDAQEHLHLVKKLKQRTMSVEYEESSGAMRTILMTEIELHDPKDALIQLAKIHGQFRDNEINVHVHLRQLSDEELLRRSRERANRLASAGLLSG